MSRAGEWRYQVLNERTEIRLLVVAPGAYNDDIKCALESTPYEKADKYTVLSYTWSSQPEDEYITFCGHPWPVSRNVVDSIRRIRSVWEPRRLWIDALCINQHNVVERTHQVSIMKEIYENSERCIIWLGEYERKRGESTSGPDGLVRWFGDDQDNELIEACLNRHLSFRPPPEGVEWKAPWPIVWESEEEESFAGAICLLSWAAQDMHLSDMPLLRDVRCLRHFTLKCLKALSWILSSPYWTRMWIVQEVVVSPQVLVYAGRIVAPFSLVEKAVANLGVHINGCCQEWASSLPESILAVVPDLEKVAFCIIPLRQIRNKWHDPESHAQLTLPRLITSTCSRKATEPRDKIYSLLGLVRNWSNQNPLRPDYATSSYEVYLRLGEWLLRDNLGNLTIAPMSRNRYYLEHQNMQVLPSWVPDLSSTTAEDHARLQFIRPLMHLFSASLHFKENFSIVRRGSRKHRDCLVLGGIWIGKFHITTRPLDSWPFPDITQLVRRDQDSYLTGESWEEAYWRTMHLDVAGAIGTAAGDSPRRLSDREVTRIVAGWSLHEREAPGSTVPPPVKQVEVPAWSLDSHVISEIEHKTVFRTDNDYLGLSLGNIKRTDEVFLPLGSPVPFVVRKSYTDEVDGYGMVQCYKLVCWCYVHGVMDGKLVHELLESRVPPTRLFLA